MRIFLTAAIIILLSGLINYVTNLPKDIGQDVPDGKLNSLSFAPFREGQSPLLLQFPTPEQIDEDLKLLADKTHTIRTYSSMMGMKVIPGLARKHGLQVIQGAWVGYYDYLDSTFTDPDTRIEIEELVASANKYPDVIKRVIVGNEVLLRGERKPAELIKYIREVKQRVKQPVSYADVWSMYMKYPELIKEVDFITIHILPYWEDEPIPVDKAPAHIERIYKQVRQEAETISPGKPILIGETGWPSIGRQRGWAVPSVVNEAAFMRGLLKVAADNQFDVNIVEAFNQPWKSELEGIIGANWGLFSADRKEVFPLTGKVYENVKWFGQYLAASAIMLLISFCFATKLQTLPTPKVAVFLVFAQVLCAILVFQADKAWYTSYDDWQRAKAAFAVALNLIAMGLLCQRAGDLLQQEKTQISITLALKWVCFTVIALSLYKTYLLAVDGRYISFPFEIAAIAVVGLVGLACITKFVNRSKSFSVFNFAGLIGVNQSDNRRHQQIAWLILFYAAGLVIGEIRAFMVGRDFIQAYPDSLVRLGWAVNFTLSNYQLMAWLACLAIFFLALIAKPNK